MVNYLERNEVGNGNCSENGCQSIGLPLCRETQTNAGIHGETLDAALSAKGQSGDPGEIERDQYLHFEANVSQDQTTHRAISEQTTA